MADLARELARNEEISGVDEALLAKLFETKAKDLLSQSGLKGKLTMAT